MVSKRSRRYRNVIQDVELDTPLPATRAISLVKQMATAKFPESVELHVRTGADPRHANQQFRDVVSLPHGTGKAVTVFVFVAPANAKFAEDGGADYVMSDELIDRIEKGWAEFDVSIATPDVMPKIARLGRLLGRKGLMPSPRSGGVVPPQDLPTAIAAAKKGRVELRMDKTAVIHVRIGSVAFEEEQLLENLVSVSSAIFKGRPEAVKGDFVKTVSMCSTMGPGVPLDIADLNALTTKN